MKYAVIALVSLILPFSLLAHENGASYEAKTRLHLIDIGYGEPVEGEAITLDFDLFTLDGKVRIAFDDVWVRISKKGRAYFAGPIASKEFGKPAMTMILPEEGSYEVSVKFSKDETVIEEAAFSFEAASRNEGPSSKKNLGYWAIALIAVFCLGWFTRRYV
jgi:hypothetical protein